MRWLAFLVIGATDCRHTYVRSLHPSMSMLLSITKTNGAALSLLNVEMSVKSMCLAVFYVSKSYRGQGEVSKAGIYRGMTFKLSLINEGHYLQSFLCLFQLLTTVSHDVLLQLPLHIF